LTDAQWKEKLCRLDKRDAIMAASMKIHYSILIVLSLLIIMLNPCVTEAQDTVEMTLSSATSKFPLELTFSLTARSLVPIVDIRLCYTTDQFSFIEIINEAYVEFVQDKSVTINWTLDMKKNGGFPPGTKVTYWWLLTDTKGNKYQTSNETIMFNDQRHTWRDLSEGQFKLYWYKGETKFAQALMDTLVEAHKKLCTDKGINFVKPVQVYIYTSTEDLRGALINPRGWEGGVAFTDYGTIMAAVYPDDLAWGKQVMSHEFAHLLTRQQSGNPYNSIPTWLSEGISIKAEGGLTSSRVERLSKAIKTDQLISVCSLSSPFLVNSDKAGISYAESGSVVDYLVHTYGADKLSELLDCFKQGSTYEEALQEIYSFRTDDLNNSWQNYVKAKYQ
jgi:uncharacterized integral membrane protein